MFFRQAATIACGILLMEGIFCSPVFAEQEASDREVSSQATPRDGSRPGWYMGRQIAPTMSAAHADWLIRDSREREEAPKKLLRLLKLQRGQHVCDFGCGNGFYTLPMAYRVGPRGKVYAVDIQQEMLDLLRDRAEPRNLRNLAFVLATETDPKLPDRKLDLVLMVDVYHELTRPAEVLRAVKKSLRPNGRLVLVEFREEDPEVPIRPLHKMSQAQVMKEMTANGLRLVGQSNELPWQHVLFFGRIGSEYPVVKLQPWSPAVSNSPAGTSGRPPEGASTPSE